MTVRRGDVYTICKRTAKRREQRRRYADMDEFTMDEPLLSDQACDEALDWATELANWAEGDLPDPYNYFDQPLCADPALVPCGLQVMTWEEWEHPRWTL